MNKSALIILDGYGIGKDSPFNAVQNANAPFLRMLETRYPASQILTHGRAVGLPDNVMGNSEVGHMTLGAGRTIYQDLTRISNAIADKTFFKNEALLKAIQNKQKLHLMGLLSDGGVHSTLEHLLALLDFCAEHRRKNICIHAFLDGRDTQPDSAVKYLNKLFQHPLMQSGHAVLASMMGRYFAMDRDNRWDRIQKSYVAITGQQNITQETPWQILEHCYSSKIYDEFIEPHLFDSNASLAPEDAVIFFNYRSDRARQLTKAMSEPSFEDFTRTPWIKPSIFVCFTEYDANLQNVSVAFKPQSKENIFAQILENHQASQLRIAETEKYAHVTFFFNGGREKPFYNEKRILIDSPKDIPTYDLKPQMSAYEIAQQASTHFMAGQFDFVLINFANADMVGHTGNYLATLKAIETLDACLKTVVSSAQSADYHLFITADHGNAETMQDCDGKMHTQHTLNPVPFIYVPPNSSISTKKDRKRLQDGTLADVMPTLCQVMDIPIPEEVTGKSLL